MSKEHIRIRYDGPALQNHTIDIDDLGLSLLALGELCKVANRQFNGETAVVKVLVNADLEQNCFELDLTITISQIQNILQHSGIATAKELLEWLGIIASAGGGFIGLIKVLKIIGPKKVNSKKTIMKEKNEVVEINIKGDNNNVYVHPQTAELLENQSAITNVKKVIAPITKEDYNGVTFERKKSKVTISSSDAEKILAYKLPEMEKESQSITAWLQLYSPVYSKDANTWKFLYSGQHITADISETDIAERTMRKGSTRVGDSYRVRLEIRQTEKTPGKYSNHYKILEVIDFKPGPEQQNILDKNS